MRYLVKVAYNGARFFGWQKQKNEVSIQEEIEKRISKIFNEEITIHASGRTDSEVHARGQVFHFDASPFPVKKLKYALNRMLPMDIEILQVKKVPDTFHARFSASEKEYEYRIYLKAKNPFLNGQVLFYPYPFNLEKLNENAQRFIGTFNFQNFTSKKNDDKNFVRRISSISVMKKGSMVSVKLCGDGFMRGQIRFMIGTLLAINEGKEDAQYIKNKLDSTNNRTIVPYKVSGCGLYLNKVWY